MSKRTVLNSDYKGLVEALSIPAVLHERDGRRFASAGSAVPIHCCTKEQVVEWAAKTHHYCDIFTEHTLAPLAELAYVRLDDNTAEKVFINRSKRMLLTSSDGALAQWRCAPTFESANRFVAGAPVVNRDGALVSLVTARSGNHYAVSTFEGDGGYFETSLPWSTVSSSGPIYGAAAFPSRAALRAHVAALPPAAGVAPGPPGVAPGPPGAAPGPPAPVLHRAPAPRVVLVAPTGRQIAHLYLHGVITDVEYL